MNFEDPRFTGQLNHTLLDAIVLQSRVLFPHSHHRTFFLDEIQNVEQWQKWLHRKLERPTGDQYVITGSNASLLSGDLASSLTGRHLTLELFPFSFSEFLRVNSTGTIENYLKSGGFPRALTMQDEAAELLREYFTDIIERDVRRNLTARKSHLLASLVLSVFESTGSELSLRKLAKILGATPDTLSKYLQACESAYLIFECPYFSFSERQRTSRNRKYYPVDTGLMFSVSKRGSVDVGKSFETIVYLELKKKFREISYWRNQNEVDFVVKTQEGILPIQVSWETEKNRHQMGAEEFKRQYPDSLDCLFVNKDNFQDLGRLLPDR